MRHHEARIEEDLPLDVDWFGSPTGMPVMSFHISDQSVGSVESVGLGRPSEAVDHEMQP
jgi:hypothetical protein